VKRVEVLLSTGDAASILGMSPDAVKRLANSKQLRVHSHTEGGHRRFLETDVQALARQLRRRS